MAEDYDREEEYDFEEDFEEEWYPPQPPTNGMGVAGFIVSIVGLTICIVVAPVGLILSIVGVRRKPKGLAIAGIVIGGLGTLLLPVFWIVFADGFSEVFQQGLQEEVGGLTFPQAWDVVEEGQFIIELEEELPGREEGQELISHLSDPWGRELRYETDGEEFGIRCAGPDGEFDTSDDVSLGIGPG